MPSLGGFPAFVTFSASSVLPGLSRAFHGGTWFPPGQVAGRGLGSQGGWRGWPQAGPLSLTCVPLRVTSGPFPFPALSLLPRLFTQTPLLSTLWAEGLRPGGVVLAGGPEQPGASTSPQTDASFSSLPFRPPPLPFLHFFTPQPLPLPPPPCPIQLRLVSPPSIYLVSPTSQPCTSSARATLTRVDTRPATSYPLKLPLPFCLQGATAEGVPDSHSGVVGHSTHHGGLGSLDDALVLGGLGDARPG